MIDKNRLEKLIFAGESERVEFKLNFSKECVETVVAMANSSGGIIIVGLSDSGNINGVNVGKETLRLWINEIKNKTSPSIIPDIEEMIIDKKSLIIISVYEFPVKPVGVQDRYYKRIKNSNHQLSVSEVANMYLQSLQTSWDSYEYPGATIKDIDFIKVESFIKKVNASGRFHIDGSPLMTLEKLNLLKDGKPTNASMILFSKKDLLHNIHIGRFKTPSYIISDKIISGSLFEVVDESMRYIIGHLKVAIEITGSPQHNEIFDYPLPAIRELLLNSIIHRDYSSPIDNQIKIFDQSISFFNPGKLYGDLTIDDLKTDNYHSHARNKLITESFYLTKDIEKYGSGLIRIRKEIREYPTMTFNYNEVGGGFWAELSYLEQKISTKVVDKVVDSLTLNQQRIVACIKTKRLK